MLYASHSLYTVSGWMCDQTSARRPGTGCDRWNTRLKHTLPYSCWWIESSRNSYYCQNTREKKSVNSSLLPRLEFDSFVGLSGPYEYSASLRLRSGAWCGRSTPDEIVNGYIRAALTKLSYSPTARCTCTRRVDLRIVVHVWTISCHYAWH
jgi:hypothetical protein